MSVALDGTGPFPRPFSRPWLLQLLRPDTRAWPVLVVVAIAVLCVRVALTWTVFSDTADEPYHISAAVSLFEAHKLVQGVQHPPLSRILPGLVLYASGVRYPPDRGNKTIHGDLVQLDSFDAGNQLLLHSPISYWQVLVRARAPMLPFAVAAVIYLYLLGRWLADRRMAALAAIFFSFDPTLLGHAEWITTDVPAVAGFLAMLYHGLRWIARPTWRRALVAGLVTGLGISCKFSCIAALPSLGLILMCRSITRGPFMPSLARKYIQQAALAALLGFLVLWATYFFDFGPIGNAAPIIGSHAWAAMPPWLKQLPIPMPSFFYGLLVVRQHERGHIAYALGRANVGGWWWYFPFALLVKEPIALLVAIPCAIWMAARRGLRHVKWRKWLIVLIPFCLFMIPAMLGHIDIGIRHILPAIAMLYLLVMLGLSRGRGPVVLALLAAVGCIETAAVHPDYIAFFNFVSGGPSNGQRWLLDSNLDWGQDEARLADYLARHAVGRSVTVRLFIRERPRDWDHPDKAHGGYDVMPPGYTANDMLAVSKNFRFDLYPSIFSGYTRDGKYFQEKPFGSELIGLRPVAHVGYSIDIYDMVHRLPADRPDDRFAQ
jgi:4-amino-4-deoxy-L-arabinose transferase-like glycosyltransferase